MMIFLKELKTEKVFRRNFWFLGAFFVLAVFLFGLFIQYVYELKPCHLCIFQRLILIGLFFIFLISALVNFKDAKMDRLILGISGVFVFVGMSVAIYQIYLQINPPVFSSCGLGAWEIFKALSWFDWVSFIFEGQGDCAKIQWHFLGISIPGWLLVFYCLLLFYLYGVCCYLKRF